MEAISVQEQRWLIKKSFNSLKKKYLSDEQKKIVYLGGLEHNFWIYQNPNSLGFTKLWEYREEIEYTETKFLFFTFKSDYRKKIVPKSILVFIRLLDNSPRLQSSIRVLETVAHEFAHVWTLLTDLLTDFQKFGIIAGEERVHEEKLFKQKLQEFSDYLISTFAAPVPETSEELPPNNEQFSDFEDFLELEPPKPTSEPDIPECGAYLNMGDPEETNEE